MPAGHRRVVPAMLLALLVGALLRCAWLTADPPTHATLGIVWHDEGPWVHNARNRALWGTWRTDNWNPVFIAPVFTALEYAAFRVFGVGTWQARTVPVTSGLVAIAALAIGLFAIGGRRAALIGATLLATNYVFVMWNRAALMESTMTAFIVVSWAAYALAGRRPAWGLAAGAAATLAWFSKAAAAFFVAAIALDALVALALARAPRLRSALAFERPSPSAERAALATVAGLGLSAALIGAFFVLPWWNEYLFYNWQMSVSRKPSYTLQALVDRASWLPIVHDFFTRMWPTVVAAAIAAVAILSRLRTAAPADRLLVLWLLIGLLELVVHDAGNERRYVMFVPALIGLSALTLGAPASLFAASAEEGRWRRWIAFPLVALLAYLAIASLLRVPFLPDIRNNEFSTTVRASAALALLAAVAVLLKWDAVVRWLARQSISPRGALIVTGLVVASDLAQYAQWARARTFYNRLASIEVGRLLPPGTLVQGKLANGLALENRIRPVFIGRGFGNYDDRASRRDVRYVLTYITPSLGYESQRQNPVITDVLDASPGWRIVRTFEVRETEGGRDQAALIDKFPDDVRQRGAAIVLRVPAGERETLAPAVLGAANLLRYKVRHVLGQPRRPVRGVIRPARRVIDLQRIGGTPMIRTPTSRQALHHAMAVSAVLMSTVVASGAQSDSPPTPQVAPPSVASLNGLRARTPDDLAKAEFFDNYGGEPLSPGSRVIQSPPLGPAVPPNYPRPLYAQFLARIVCAVRAVVVGRANPVNVHLNGKGTFLFTTYDVAVDRWLYPPSGAPGLQIALAGGSARVGGELTAAEPSRPLDQDGPSLFFLVHIPGSGALTPVRPVISSATRVSDAWGYIYLPHELVESTVTWDALLDDLQEAGRQCSTEGR